MKRTAFLIVSAFALVASAAPQFVTGRMIDRRNGLTDEQYEILWEMGKTPQITPRVARDWVFRAGRYQNVTNWLDVCGKTNNFAALSYKLQGDNFILEDRNAVLTATNGVLVAQCEELAYQCADLYEQVTNEIAKCSSLSNMLVIVTAQANAASAKIQDEIADLQAKIVKYKEYQTKYPILKSVFAAMITDAENRIKVLQALTSN